MKVGKVVEYIEHRKIVCAVVLKVDKKKLRVLAESNREIKLSNSRVSHESTSYLDLSVGRVQLVELLKQISLKRNRIASKIDVRSIWIKANKFSEWIDIKNMSKFCFPLMPTEHQEAGLIRACFDNKLYFKFKPVMFSPNSKERIDELELKAKKEEKEKIITNVGSDWINNITAGASLKSINRSLLSELKEILSSYYIHKKESPYYRLSKKILNLTKLNSNKKLFNFMVKIGVWNINENLDILRFNIPEKFSQKEIVEARKIESYANHKILSEDRFDFTDKFTITIDGSGSLDFDDALSIEKEGNNYLVGIHVSDVSHYIEKGSLLDKTAFARICSIYTPDVILPMLPANLSEDFLSLKKGKIRLSISALVRLDSDASIVNYEIHPSIVKVDKQLNYTEANKAIEYPGKIHLLYSIAKKLRKKRMQAGSTQIRLPELNVILEKSSKYQLMLKKIDRESPSRILVEEMMILHNWVSAQFLSKYKIPAIFRSQSEPRKQVIKNHLDSLFHNWMQKKMLRRVSLKDHAERHCVLGLNAYVTATSPIRRFSDLVVQRQLKSLMSIGRGYTKDEINKVISVVTNSATQIFKIQSQRIKYWVLKYLEQRIGEKQRAIVLQKKRGEYNILITEYLLECALQQPNGITLEPKDIIQIVIQYVNARNGVITVFMV